MGWMSRDPNSLDDLTGERLLRGSLGPEDAPPGYAPVALLLGQARGGLERADLGCDDAVVAGLAAAVLDNPSTDPRRRPVITKLLTAKAAAVAAALTLSATAAAASTGNLPGPAQHALARVAAHAGLDLPDSGGSGDATDANDTPETTTPDTTAPETTVPDGSADTPTTVDNPDNHGGDVSGVAHSSDPGPDHGDDVSTVARGDHGSNDQGGSDTTEPTETTDPPQANDGHSGDGSHDTPSTTAPEPTHTGSGDGSGDGGSGGSGSGDTTPTTVVSGSHDSGSGSGGDTPTTTSDFGTGH
jgi:hypothetical protein